MVEISQTPAAVNIIAAIDDSFSTAIDLDISLTGKTVVAAVDTIGGTSTSFTITETDLSAGQVSISLTSSQMAAIGEGTHRWYLKYYDGSTSRRAFAGSFRVVKYNP